MIVSLCLLATLIVHIEEINGHARLIFPASRSTAWRYGFKNPPNFNDHQLHCGGIPVQHFQNGGKCGVCGDPYNGPIENQPGPDNKYANGIIVAEFNESDDFIAMVEATVPHRGWFEFRICANNDPTKAVSQDCLDKHVLSLASNGTGTKYKLPSVEPGIYEVHLQLPPGLTCSQCVLQWKYHTGNHWGCDDSGCCVGCGDQEELYSCADIKISPTKAVETNVTSSTSKSPMSSSKSLMSRFSIK